MYHVQHVEAAQATIIPLFSESYDAFKTSVSVGFPGNALDLC